MAIDATRYARFLKMRELNENASDVRSLYAQPDIKSPTRPPPELESCVPLVSPSWRTSLSSSEVRPRPDQSFPPSSAEDRRKS